MLATLVLGPPNHIYEAIQTFHVPYDERRRLTKKMTRENSIRLIARMSGLGISSTSLISSSPFWVISLKPSKWRCLFCPSDFSWYLPSGRTWKPYPDAEGFTYMKSVGG